jgi:aspartyl-tRNA(Asn)/glutamyl-tRNA(Gln) amidotransferase subunit A
MNSRRTFLKTSLGATAWWAIKSPFAEPTDLTGMTLKRVSELLRSKQVSPVDLTKACFKRIDKYNSALNAFITVTRDEAMTTAREMEAEQQRGKWRGPLHGVPIALKDNIDTAGIRTTGASELFKDRIPSEDAEVVRRLKSAGTVFLGKLNLHEFAYGGTTTVSYYGPAHNPWALDHQTGGSSGGPAAALAADLCFGSLGTDTAGSVRIPGSYCGIVGFKPTYGRVSNRGVIPLSWTLDHTGPMAKCVEDAAILLNVIAGYDEKDPTTVDMPVPDYTRALRTPVSKLRLGVPRTPFFDNVNPEVAKAVEAAIDVLRKMTASVIDIQLPPAGNPADVWTPEIYAYHATWIHESPEKYQPATRNAILRALEANAGAYAQARRNTDLARREIKKVFSKVDLIVTPTMKQPAPLIVPAGGPAAAPGGSNTSQFDVYGIPTISIPCGFTAAGLPIGLQIAGAPWAESTVLALAYAYEQATEWHTRHPKV